jgi:hypothetical protein
MATPPIPIVGPGKLAEVQSKWAMRRQQAVAQGFNPAPIEQLYQQDWAKVAAGGTAMTTEEAQASISAAYGSPQVTQHRPGGILGTLENVPTDIAGMGWNLLPGLAKTVEHLPSEVTKTGEYLAHATDNNWLAAHGYETFSGGLLSHLAETTRNFARTPLLPLAVPGLSTAAGLTTAQGRQGLEQHPVGTALDVAPFVGSLASLGAFGGAASETIEAGNVADQADKLVRAGQTDLADRLAQSHGYANYDELASKVTSGQRAASALAAGRPIKALTRAVPVLDQARLSVLDRFGITPRAQATRRVIAAGQTSMARQLDHHARELRSVLLEPWMTKEDTNAIGALAGRPDLWPTADPRYQSVLTRLQSYSDAQTAADVAQTDQLYKTTLSNGKEVVYGGQQATRAQSLQANLDHNVGIVNAAQDRVVRLQAQLDDAQRALDTATQMRERSLRIGRSTSGLIHPEDRGQAALGITQGVMLGTQIDAARRAVEKITKDLGNAKTAAAEAGDKLHTADQAMQKFLAKNVPARFKPLVESQVRTKISAWLTGQHVAEDDPKFREAMAAFDRGKPLSAYLPDKVFHDIQREVVSHWQELAENYNPIWVPSMSSEDLERGIRTPRLRDAPKTPASWKSSYINRSSGSTNFVLALGQDYANKLAYETNRKIVDDFVRPHARTTSEIDKELEPEFEALQKRYGTTRSKAELQNMARTKAYHLVDESLGLGTQPKMELLYKERLWIPKDMAEAISKSFAPPDDNVFKRINFGSIRLYKHAVMDFSPTHKAHIWLGSMLPLMLGAHFETFDPTTIHRAWQMGRNAARGSMPDLLNQHLALMATDDLMDYAHGLTLGRLAAKASGAAEVSRHIDELGANFYRSWAYLSHAKYLERQGLDAETAAAEGIAYANKAFVDVNNLSPIEQALAKSVFPFYSYTRWAMTFVMQYPIDHPVRASILANLAEQEKTYNDKKGIPNTLAMLFMLGKPSSKGDQWGVQYRAFNPFRDVASNFTLAGIFKNLGPAGRILATAGGINTLSGTPDPYPALDIDPNTGGLVGTVQGQSPLAAAEQIVPQVSILDHYLGLSQQARALRTSDPQAFRRQIFSILGMPFVPQSYTPKLSAATRGRDQLRVAQQEVSSAMKNHDLSMLDIYDNIPVPAAVRPYVGGVTVVPLSEYKKVVEQIWAQERTTGIKII